MRHEFTDAAVGGFLRGQSALRGIAAFGSWICGSNGFRQIGLIVFRKSCFREVLRDAVASPARQGRETLAPEPMQLSLAIVESPDG